SIGSLRALASSIDCIMVLNFLTAPKSLFYPIFVSMSLAQRELNHYAIFHHDWMDYFSLRFVPPSKLFFKNSLHPFTRIHLYHKQCLGSFHYKLINLLSTTLYPLRDLIKKVEKLEACDFT
ncbi:MAG: hypothetical protein ACHQAX_07435, partial [Gammaproteobacteria bacterium]